MTGHVGARDYPITPDRRYFVVRGRLWRMSDPSLTDDRRENLVRELMEARRRVGSAKREGDQDGEHAARRTVDHVKRALGERGPVWWGDGAPDFNRYLVRNSPYADWFASLSP